MSFSSQKTVKCPCGEEFDAVLWDSVNADRTPELRESLLAGMLNVVACPRCGQYVYAEKFLLYHEPHSELLAFVYPSASLAEKEKWEKQTVTDFQKSQDASPEEEKIKYPPVIFFGLDTLVSLLSKEQEEQDQGEIAASLAVSAGIKIARLSPSLARRSGVPAILPYVSHERKSPSQQILEGLHRIVKANDRLSVYLQWKDDLPKSPALTIAFLDSLKLP
ncbi:MAG TPA: CpXC domain-containing protein [Elusimicrobiota bacterium]|nr:CpXC domain-containing protein [Elusimicrobiota bacterium]